MYCWVKRTWTRLSLWSLVSFFILFAENTPFNCSLWRRPWFGRYVNYILHISLCSVTNVARLHLGKPWKRKSSCIEPRILSLVHYSLVQISDKRWDNVHGFLIRGIKDRPDFGHLWPWRCKKYKGHAPLENIWCDRLAVTMGITFISNLRWSVSCTITLWSQHLDPRVGACCWQCGRMVVASLENVKPFLCPRSLNQQDKCCQFFSTKALQRNQLVFILCQVNCNEDLPQQWCLDFWWGWFCQDNN